MDRLLKIQEIVDEFLKRGFGETYKAEYTLISESEIKIDITGLGVSYLIGQHGRTLLSLQHIIRQIYINTTQDYDESVKLIIDVDQYKQKRIEKIKEIAQKAVDKCHLSGVEVSLPSMNPFERHVVHTYVQENYTDISSSSSGEEPNRRIVLKPAVK
jgi:spoIIIJ-associated protein